MILKLFLKISRSKKIHRKFKEISLIQRNFLWIKENLWFKEKVFEFDQNSKKIQRKNEAKNRKKIFKEKVFESKKIQTKFKEISLIQRYLWKQGEANTFVPIYSYEYCKITIYTGVLK